MVVWVVVSVVPLRRPDRRCGLPFPASGGYRLRIGALLAPPVDDPLQVPGQRNRLLRVVPFLEQNVGATPAVRAPNRSPKRPASWADNQPRRARISGR